MLKMNRDSRLDVLRAWGIILVVAGHNHSPFFDYIYTFHMPLFFFISGFLRYNATQNGWKLFLKNRTKSSLLPYVLFWIFSMLIYGELVSFFTMHKPLLIDINSIKGLVLGGRWLYDYSNNFALWYLQLFFIASILFEMIVRLSGAKTVLLGGLLSLFLTKIVQIWLPGRPIFHINVLPAAIAFMAIGYLFHMCMERFHEVSILFNRISVGVFLLILGWCISFRVKGNIAEIPSYWYFLGAVFTILALYSLCSRFVRFQFFQYIGRNTLGILGLHTLMIRWAREYTQYLFERMSFHNDFFVHFCTTILTVIMCCALIEGWRFIKSYLWQFFRKEKLRGN